MSTFFDRGTRGDGGPSGIIGIAADPRTAGLIYEPFYGLREKPFSLSSDARFFYQSRAHAPAFDDLLRAIRRRESLTVLSGDIGTGKTTLCRAVLQSLDHKTFSAFVPDPFASREDLLKLLLTEFGVASSEDVTTGPLRDASRTQLTYLLHEFLGSLAPLHAFAVVFVDEAQNLSVPLLEELRILSDSDSQMQVVLVGQLELNDRLRLPEMRQLDQRISARCRLEPLDLAGVAGYVSHRLHRAGGTADRVSFSGEAIEAIFEMSGGVPRVINKVCDRALQTAYAQKAASIERQIVEAANADHQPVSKVTKPAPSASTPPPSSIPPPPSARSGDPVDTWLDNLKEASLARGADPGESQDDEMAQQPSCAAEPRSRSGRQLRIRVGYVAPNPVRATRTPMSRKWARRLELVAFSLLLLLMALMVGPSVWDAGSDTLIYIHDQFDPPPPAFAIDPPPAR